MHKLVQKLARIGIYNETFSAAPRISRRTITKMRLNTVELPKQPVPSLSATAEKYLRSLQPILSDAEFQKTEKIVKEFVSEKGVGPCLQKELMKRYEATDNWMSEWWLKTAYLGYRAPVIVNSSPGTVSVLPSLNKENYVLLAAHLVNAILDYYEMIKSGKLKQEKARDAPLDMQPYAMILGSHRRPKKDCDELLHTDEACHIVVMHNGSMHKVEVSGTKCNVHSIYSALRNIVTSCEETCVPVGILTGNDRDSWAVVHEELLRLGNGETLRDIEEALFVLCIDKPLPEEELKGKSNLSVRAVQCMTGGSSSTNAFNRWHDKIVQYIISPDGLVGMEYEHSPCEAVPIAVLHDFVLKTLVSAKQEKVPECPPSLPTKRLEFKTDSSIQQHVSEATQAVEKLSKDIDMDCFSFQEFGTDRIKELRYSPDSFIQVAMQVAYYSLHCEPPVHYESAGLRRFQNARTECIRSTSCDSLEFAKNMKSRSMDQSALKDLMAKAVNTHKNLANEAALGQGVDRHLFGLKMIAKEQGIQSPEIFEDVGYKKSTYFTLTSSQVPYKTDSFLCYGPVVPDGYGCCYNPRPKDIYFSCASFRSCDKTSTEKFAKALRQALCDMAELAARSK